MKAGNTNNPGSRLAQVADLERLRRQAKDDPAVKAQVTTIVEDGRLRAPWEDRDTANVVALPKRRHGAGTRHAQLEAQIERATCPQERRMFELRRDQLERDEEKGASRRQKAAA